MHGDGSEHEHRAVAGRKRGGHRDERKETGRRHLVHGAGKPRSLLAAAHGRGRATGRISALAPAGQRNHAGEADQREQ